LDEFRFEQDLVRALLREQHRDLADLELRDVVGGWDNQQWRLGAELAVRLPRTEHAPALLRTEQKWLPVLAQRLPLPTPTPVRIGEPSALFEHTWTITRWVEASRRTTHRSPAPARPRPSRVSSRPCINPPPRKPSQPHARHPAGRDAGRVHRQLSDEELRAAGVGPGTVRLSVGTESVDDLIWDLEQGLATVAKEVATA
jgi:hypothetical protein